MGGRGFIHLLSSVCTTIRGEVDKLGSEIILVLLGFDQANFYVIQINEKRHVIHLIVGHDYIINLH